MCDYCDCRSRNQLAAFGREHAEILVRVHDLERLLDAEETERTSALVADLLGLLDPHSRSEEVGLYRELDEAGVDVGHFSDEHQEVHELLRCPSNSERAAALAHLRGHIHREEYDLFPAAHQLLDDAAWDRLERDSAPAARR